MLVCSTDDDFGVDENDSPKKKDKDKKFSWIHGSELHQLFFHCNLIAVVKIANAVGN